ncbi:S-adenosyl-L-methionine-dependent methyltransferase [Wolfiporia cocos MD-104 SS10]|uniref:S-adenosyl-L-methionine-dependent methyltransferase n=1 Tax=Wolfiporia cocos (strain MD-104) TaxID=742152 RepID=A0A2H3J818_WOLCO|nr:S-adenosyl-L-methionine-dependent methyltransferase [Wolfiporia cocos MD-104 SS10]
MAAPAVDPYINGHHESVLRSHSWRTVENSAAYVLKVLRPNMHILDVGCGPGTITIDFATRVPRGQVIGLENSTATQEQFNSNASMRGVSNVKFVVGDVLKLDFPDNTFDIVHAHQVIQHVTDPLGALREMRRVTKPGGFIAVREADFASNSWFPEEGILQDLYDWRDMHFRVARTLGGEPNAGRRLVAWARDAGFDRAAITATTSAWCYSTPEERAWWTGLWVDRVLYSSFAKNVISLGYGTQDDLERMARAWQKWGASEDGWYALMHGEILCRK